MNKKQVNLLCRIRHCINLLKFPNNLGSTASVKEFVQFYQDFQRIWKHNLDTAWDCIVYDNDLNEAEKIITEIELSLNFDFKKYQEEQKQIKKDING